MKRLIILLATGLVLLPMIADGAQTAQARLHCRSLHVDQGHVTGTGGLWFSDMSSLTNSVNGELAPNFLAAGIPTRRT